MTSADSQPHYPAIEPSVLRVIGSALLGRRRSFRADALALTAKLTPPLQVHGAEQIPSTGPYLVTANHYSRPGFSTSWIALSISSVIEPEVTWITVTEWVYPRQRRELLLRPIMRFVLTYIRKGYDFLAMPTMTPGYASPQQRAEGVRKVMRAVKNNPSIILGLTPEGMDFPGGQLGMPPSGAGKFMLTLNQMGLRILPAAVFEHDGHLCLNFGIPYDLTLPPDVLPSTVDAFVSREVMARIAALLA